MAVIHSDEFKRDAVRIAQTSGLTRRQVASDLGIGHSTLGKWARMFSEEAKVPAQDAELLRENERLRKENRILRDLSRIRKQSGGLFSRRMWEVLKKGSGVLRGPKATKFQYIADYSSCLTRSSVIDIRPVVSGNIEMEATARDREVIETARRLYAGPIIGAAGYSPDSAEAALQNGLVDLVAFGRAYVGNPDLVAKIHCGAPFADNDQSTLYTQGRKGYTDYPTFA